MYKVFISPFNDPYLNVAIERYLFRNAHNNVLYLWRNNPCVIIGRNQNVYSECNLDYIIKNDIKILRRFSGGGAVYQDLGNLNYTLILDEDHKEENIKEYILNCINDLGLNAKFSGRNDILLDELKISGTAYCVENHRIMFHGTLLIDVDIDNLVNALTPNRYKLESHAIKSVKSRILNIKERYNLDYQEFIDSFIKKLNEYTIDEIVINNEITELVTEIKDDKWIYNDCPKFNISFDKKTEKALYTINLKVVDGVVEDVVIYTDDLNCENVKKITKAFLKKEFDIYKISKIINEYTL